MYTKCMNKKELAIIGIVLIIILAVVVLPVPGLPINKKLGISLLIIFTIDCSSPITSSNFVGRYFSVQIVILITFLRLI